ncbi:MAG: tRNA (adenosine(37)-N6)-dimethylallyltransferase MiaA [Rhizobiaceae bacterium]
MSERVQKPDAILIAGPTASGKSKLALELARRYGGEIVNTDSMQIYPVLRVLSARPDEVDMAQTPHHLYGYAPIEEPYSVARWLEDAKQKANELWKRDVVPIFVGGTGLYFKALEEGLAGTPDIPSQIRAEIRADLLRDGSEKLHGRLQKLDPKGAENLQPSDGHRIARALEVVVSTGNSLQFFQNQPVSQPLLSGKNCQRLVLMPERSLLHTRINSRTEQMMDEGAIDEVRALLALNLPIEATVLKAIGVPQLSDFILGKQALNESVEKIRAATRQYSKRQSTWFKGQFSDDWQFAKSLGEFEL